MRPGAAVPRGPVLVGLDLGTSGLKAVAVTADGQVVGRARAGYPTRRPDPGSAEQDPLDWLSAATAAVGQLAAAVPTDRWVGVGLTAMIPTLVLTDRAGAPLGPACTWEDGRAEPHAARLRAVLDGQALYRRTGQWLDGRYLLPMAARLAEAQPELAAVASFMLGAKDLLFGWLTGVQATDPSTATGYGCYDLSTGGWAPEVVEAAGLAAPGPAGPARPERGREQALWALGGLGLPPVRPSTTAMPLLASRAADLGLPAGLPVVLGAADSVCGALGLGVRSEGDVAYLAGTSTVMLAVSERALLDSEHRYLVTPLAAADGWGLEMDLLSTGSAVRWLAGVLGPGVDEDTVLELAGSIDPAAEGLPVFGPYLAPGEQGALWDPDLRGTLSGLGLEHGRAEVARALMTGILVESRRCMSLLAAVVGEGPLWMAGHTTTGRFGQDLSDACGRVVHAAATAGDASAVGAAHVAALALLGSALPAPVPAQTFAADPRRAPVWAAVAARHDAVLAAVPSR